MFYSAINYTFNRKEIIHTHDNKYVSNFHNLNSLAQEEATYVEGYENGPSVVNFLSGKREERTYEGGVLSGPAVVYGTDGDKFEFSYVEGKIQGNINFKPLRVLI